MYGSHKSKIKEFAKPRYDRVYAGSNDDERFKQVGQDVLVRTSIFNNTLDIIAIFDGHGDDGSEVALSTAKRMLQVWSDTVLCNETDALRFFSLSDDDIARIVNKVFDSVADKITSKMSGTTCVWCMHCKQTGTLLTCNCGDSQAMLVTSVGKSISLTNVHNCDNDEECTKYHQRMKSMGMDPMAVVYGRSSWKVYRACDNKGDLVKCERSKRIIEEAYPFGVQTLYDSSAYGNTLMGKLQLLRGFGDTDFRPHIIHTPHVNIHRYIREESIRGTKLILCSDGMSDAIIPETLTEYSTMNNVLDHVSSMHNSEFGVSASGHPVWDDVTAVVVDMNAKNNSVCK